MNNIFKSHTGKSLLTGMATCLVAVSLSSCADDFLGKKPLDTVSQEDYYTKADALAAFTVNYYTSIFTNNSNWNGGQIRWDDGTDNQANADGNSGRFLQDQWKVPTNGGFGFGNIRALNKFINENEARIREGKISGDKAQIDHYMGEAYVIRAMLYFDRLRTYGDYPIVDEELSPEDDLVSYAARQPRNLVARHILADLDKAISLLLDTHSGKLRITKPVAYAFKSRVALYEGTFELYHRASGRVPGDADWPGKDKEWNKDRTFDQQGEVTYFLTQAKEAAKYVADRAPLTPSNHVLDPSNTYNGWNPYYDMFASPDLSANSEVLMWEEFNHDLSVAHLTSNKLRTGPATGWTRGLVESFLMKNGLPIYANNSGYHGDKTIDATKVDRDERLQLFMFGESTLLGQDADGQNDYYAPNLVNTNKETLDITGYRQRKLYNYDPAMQNGQSFSDVSGMIIIRSAEARLDYIEASYLLSGTLDATAKKYWTELRARAGITAPIETTIEATDMSYEADVNRPSYDWGAFSAGKPVDATLYSIRRERRSEFAGEGSRWYDLVRWRALDQVKNYQIEGMNFWDEYYNKEEFQEGGKQEIIADGSAKSTMSAKELSKYIRPYQRVKLNNILYNGYTFYQAHYLSPFSVDEMKKASATKDAKASNLYQNPGWPTEADGMAQY